MLAGYYRKKPVVIMAMQYDGTDRTAKGVTGWVISEGGMCVMYSEPAEHLSIHTSEGVMRASPGDWIIKGVKGEFYPCKPDIFEQTYEPVS